MRRSAFALIALFPAIAYANDPQPLVGPAGDTATAPVQTSAAMPDAGRIGAAMGGDALPCGEAPAITNADVSEGLGGNALADADAYAGMLGELPAKATQTVKSLNETYPIGEDAIKRNYFVAVCQRLKEKSVAIETLKPALASLAQTLGLPAPAAADVVPNQPAPPAGQGQPAPQAGTTPPALAAGDRVAIAPEAPSTAVEPKAPETAPTAPAVTATPNAPTDIQPPATPAEGAAPAAEARPETAGQPTADTKVEQAPAGVPASPAATARMAETAPPPGLPSTETGLPSTEAKAQPADPAATQQVIQGQTPPGTPGADQPGAPHTSTMAQGDAPAGQPTPQPGPQAMQASPGSVEQPAAARTPEPAVAQAPAPTAAPPAESAAPTSPSSPPAVAEAPAPTPSAPAAPPTPPSPPAVAEAPAPTPVRSAPVETPAPPSPPAMAEAPAPVPSASAETPTPVPSAPAETPAPPSPPAVADAPAPAAPTPPPAMAAAPERPRPPLPAGAGQLSEDECYALGVPANCADLNGVLARLLERPLEYNRPQTMFQYRKSDIGLVLRTDWNGKDMPADVAEELKALPGEVGQGITKITRVMSAELSGNSFDIAPSGRQERMVVVPQPVSWTWQVTPKESGPGKTLRLRLYTHIEGPSGMMSPTLVKTLDTGISVDVKTWDWVVAQIRMVQPIYAVMAALLALLTVILTYAVSRSGEETGPSGPTRKRGPVIGDLDQSTKPRADES